MEFLKVKSLLKWTNGSEEKVCKKVTVTDHAFYKKIDRQIWLLGGAFDHNFSPVDGNSN